MNFSRSCIFINLLIFVLTCGIIGCAIQDKRQSSSGERSKVRRIFELQKQKGSKMVNEEWSTKESLEMSAEEYERLGDNYASQGNLVMAFVQYNNALGLDPSLIGVRYKVGQLFLRRGMNGEAMVKFEEILKNDANNALAYEGKGIVFFERGKLDRSEKSFRRAVNLDPKLWKAHTFLGVIYDRREQYEAAINEYQKAIAINPDSSILFNDLGISNYLKGDYEKSLEALSKALKIEPENSRLYNNLGLALCKLGRYDDAFKAFRSGGDEASAYNNIGYIYLTEQKYKESIYAFEKAIEIRRKFYLKAHENIKKARAGIAGIAEVHVGSLTVNNGTANAVSDMVTENTTNLAPIADVGSDKSVHAGDNVILDGSNSSDPDGDQLTFKWSFTTKPSNSEATLDDTTSVDPTFTVDAAGVYIVSLTVNDGTVDSIPGIVVIHTINVAPIADGGFVQSVYVGDKVILDGGNSFDPDDDQLTFKWSFTTKPLKSETTLYDTTSANPNFIADAPGTYVISLTVNDGIVESEPDTVPISTINVAPIADGGAVQSVNVGDLVILDGSNSSDPDGDQLAFNWNFTSKPWGSTAMLDESTSVNPTFTADVPGTYVISLTVNDGIMESEPDTVPINTINVAPIADGGFVQSVYVGDKVILDGSNSSDTDGDQLAFNWNFTSKPLDSTATLDEAASMNPTFIADVPGSYVISLTVNDGIIESEPDTVPISTINVAPIADGGFVQSVYVGDKVILDGSNSSDTDGDQLAFNWTFTSKPLGSTATLDEAASMNPTFTADVPGSYVISFTVNDGTVNSIPGIVVIHTINVAPIADGGAVQSVNVGDLVILDGSNSSDTDGDLLTFNWTFTSKPLGSTATLDEATSMNPTFIADVPGVYDISLIVNDGTVNSNNIDIVTISTVKRATTSISKVQESKEINVLDTDSGVLSNPNSQKMLSDKAKLGD